MPIYKTTLSATKVGTSVGTTNIPFSPMSFSGGEPYQYQNVNMSVAFAAHAKIAPSITFRVTRRVGVGHTATPLLSVSL